MKMYKPDKQIITRLLMLIDPMFFSHTDREHILIEKRINVASTITKRIEIRSNDFFIESCLV